MTSLQWLENMGMLIINLAARRYFTAKYFFAYLRFSQAPLYIAAIAIISEVSNGMAAFLAFRVSIVAIAGVAFGFGASQTFNRMNAIGKSDYVRSRYWFVLSLIPIVLTMFFSTLVYKYSALGADLLLPFVVSCAVMVCAFLNAERYRSYADWRRAIFTSLGIDAHVMVLSAFYILNHEVDSDFLSPIFFLVAIYYSVVHIYFSTRGSGDRISFQEFLTFVISMRSSIAGFWLVGLTMVFIGELATVLSSRFGNEELIAISLATKISALIILPMNFLVVVNMPRFSSELCRDICYFKSSLAEVSKKVFRFGNMALVLVVFFAYPYYLIKDYPLFILSAFILASIVNLYTGLASIYLSLLGLSKKVFWAQFLGAVLSGVGFCIAFYFNSYIGFALSGSLGIVVSNLLLCQMSSNSGFKSSIFGVENEKVCRSVQ